MQAPTANPDSPWQISPRAEAVEPVVVQSYRSPVGNTLQRVPLPADADARYKVAGRARHDTDAEDAALAAVVASGGVAGGVALAMLARKKPRAKAATSGPNETRRPAVPPKTQPAVARDSAIDAESDIKRVPSNDFYHESQVGELCGLHALRSALKGRGASAQQRHEYEAAAKAAAHLRKPPPFEQWSQDRIWQGGGRKSDRAAWDAEMKDWKNEKNTQRMEPVDLCVFHNSWIEKMSEAPASYGVKPGDPLFHLGIMSLTVNVARRNGELMYRNHDGERAEGESAAIYNARMRNTAAETLHAFIVRKLRETARSQGVRVPEHVDHALMLTNVHRVDDFASERAGSHWVNTGWSPSNGGGWHRIDSMETNEPRISTEANSIDGLASAIEAHLRHYVTTPGLQSLAILHPIEPLPLHDAHVTPVR